MKNRYLYFNLILIILISCKSWKNTLIKNGNKEDAMLVVMKDYLSKVKSNKKTFQVFNMNTYKSFHKSIYTFDVMPIDYFTLQDTAGQYSKTFPTMYKIIDDKMFVWRDSTIPVSQKLIDTFFKRKVTDSIGYKMLSGKSSFDSLPENDIENEKFERFYYICKENLTQFKRTKRYYWRKKDIEKIKNKLHCTQ